MIHEWMLNITIGSLRQALAKLEVIQRDAMVCIDYPPEIGVVSRRLVSMRMLLIETIYMAHGDCWRRHAFL